MGPRRYNGPMASLKQIIIEKFLADLAERKSLDEPKINELRKLLADTPKVKTDDLVKIFTGSGDSVA